VYGGDGVARAQATDPDAGNADAHRIVVVVVVEGVVVVVAAVVVEPVVVDVDVVTSAITAPEKAPAAVKPSTKGKTTYRRFTTQAV
jgi:hypothetical protein